MTRCSTRGLVEAKGTRYLSAAFTLAVCLSPFLYTKALAPNAETLQVGPVYTSQDGKQLPEFPRLQIVVSPPGQRQAPPLAGDLTLIEDGADGGHATEVTSFDSTGYGLAAVVAIDVSGSMAGKPIDILRGSLYKFVSDARPQDRVGVVTIADDATWDVPFGTDPETMKTRLQAMKTRGTKTRLYDGLLTALGGFDGAVPVPARRVLTVISDGHDEGSRSTLDQVVQAARDGNIAIDAIGLTRSAPQYLKTLSSLASQTGGSFQQVHSDKELDTLIGNGMTRLKATPVASFEAQHISADGQRHTLGVRWSAGGGVSGEAAFTAPKLSGGQVARSLRHMPPWGYGVLAAVCCALLVAAIFAIRRLRRGDAAADVPYALPPQPFTPPHSGGLSSEHGFAGETFTPGGFGRQVETAGIRPPASVRSAPLAVAPAADPSAQPASRHKQTRLAGVFQSLDGAIARLDILTGTLSGTSVEVLRGEFWIGASSSNQFVLSNDATVSSRHAYLIFEGPILILVDNRSTNGTRVNGKMLRGERQPVRDGDQIQIGQTLLRLRSLS